MGSATLCTFHLFAHLPTELRLAVWEFALPEAAPEIYFIDPSNFNYDRTSEDGRGKNSDDEWIDETFTDAKVTTGYPAMMHACHEARLIALEKLTFQSAQLRSRSRVQVPCRDFRPNLDAFYINAIDVGMIIETVCAAEDDWYKDIKHVALQAECLIHGFDDLCPHLVKFSSLRELSIVYGRSWGVGPLDFNEVEAKRYPTVRHYRLKEYTKQAGCLIYGSEYSTESVKSTVEDLYDTLRLVDVLDDSPWDRDAGKWLFTVEPKMLAKVPQHGLSKVRNARRGSGYRSATGPSSPRTNSNSGVDQDNQWLSFFNFNYPLALLQPGSTS